MKIGINFFAFYHNSVETANCVSLGAAGRLSMVSLQFCTNFDTASECVYQQSMLAKTSARGIAIMFSKQQTVLAVCELLQELFFVSCFNNDCIVMYAVATIRIC